MPRSRRLRVFVADPDPAVRQRIRSILGSHTRYHLCGEVTSGDEAIERAQATRPDVVLLDADLPGTGGLEAARQIATFLPHAHIILLTRVDSEDVTLEILAGAARGRLPRKDISRELRAALDTVCSGRVYVTAASCARLMRKIVQQMPRHVPPAAVPLTSRQQQVLKLVAEGKTSKEIARLLSISAKTADMHRSAVKERLGLSSLSDVIRYAIFHHITELDPKETSRGAVPIR